MRSMAISAFVQRWLSYHPWMVSGLTMVALRSRVKRGCGGGARQGGVAWPGSVLHSWGAYDGLPNNELAEASGNRRLPTVSVAVQGPSSEPKNKQTWTSPGRVVSQIAIARTRCGQPNCERWLGEDCLND
jgi:hypothetical protein